MLEPIYRIEFFLDAIVNNTTPPEPIYREEFYLAKIAGADVEIPEPVYRMEKYLAYLCGVEVELPDPIYRIEYYLAFLCGLNVELPEPIYRVEFWLWDWCGGGGIEKTIIGNPIHILDALAKPAQALSVKLEPIQDLNGYDNPWPAGGGKNKINYLSCIGVGARDGTDSLYGNNTSISGTELTINLAYGDNGGILKGIGTFPLATGEYVTISGKATLIDTNYLMVGISNYDGGGTNNINSSVAVINGRFSVTLNAKSDYAKTGIFLQPQMVRSTAVVSDVMVAFGQTEQPYSPYSNICPISGHTYVDVTRTGENLWNFNRADRVNGFFDTSGNFVPSNSFCCLSFPCSEGMKFVKSGSGSGWGGINTYWNGNTFVSANNTASPTIPSGANIVKFACQYAATDAQLELGSTASDYEPYQGETYPIPLGQTVYGGTLDVLTGVLTVTMAMVDLGSLNYNPYTYAGVFGGIAIVTPAPKPFPAGEAANAKCSALKVVSDNVFNLDGLKAEVVINAIGSVKVKGVNATTAAELKAELSGVMLCYELAIPQTYQLTPTEVTLLLGENNIWSDGTMTLVYLADGNASDEEALNILLGGRYVNNHGEDEPSDREALNIILGGNER